MERSAAAACHWLTKYRYKCFQERSEVIEEYVDRWAVSWTMFMFSHVSWLSAYPTGLELQNMCGCAMVSYPVSYCRNTGTPPTSAETVLPLRSRLVVLCLFLTTFWITVISRYGDATHHPLNLNNGTFIGFVCYHKLHTVVIDDWVVTTALIFQFME